MNAIFILALVIISCCVFNLKFVSSYSHGFKRSGISDQRLSDIEARLALEANREQPPVAFGLVNPDEVGKKKRTDFSNYEDNLTNYLLKRLRKSSIDLDEEENNIVPYLS